MMDKSELKEILKQHNLWLQCNGGKRADLTDANLMDAIMTGANLTGANLTRADLTDANMMRADLTRANLTDAIMTSADLTDADLMDAKLTRAIMTCADLTGSDLTRADLTDAKLTGADLKGADLTDAELNDGTSFDMASFPLWCGSFRIKATTRLVAQLFCHIARLDISGCSKKMKLCHKIVFSIFGKYLANAFCEYRNDIKKI